jgi:hypothetical protein
MSHCTWPEKFILKIENGNVKNIEIMQITWYSLKAEANVLREVILQITFENKPREQNYS